MREEDCKLKGNSFQETIFSRLIIKKEHFYSYFLRIDYLRKTGGFSESTNFLIKNELSIFANSELPSKRSVSK